MCPDSGCTDDLCCDGCESHRVLHEFAVWLNRTITATCCDVCESVCAIGCPIDCIMAVMPSRLGLSNYLARSSWGVVSWCNLSGNVWTILATPIHTHTILNVQDIYVTDPVGLRTIMINFVSCLTLKQPLPNRQLRSTQQVTTTNGDSDSGGGTLRCNSMGCPGGYIPIADAATTVCDADPCEASQCCEANGSFHPCPDGFTPINDSDMTECPDSGCTDDHCCNEREYSCRPDHTAPVYTVATAMDCGACRSRSNTLASRN